MQVAFGRQPVDVMNFDAIRQHDSPGSEAHTVIDNFNALTPQQRQDLLAFLRSVGAEPLIIDFTP